MANKGTLYAVREACPDRVLARDITRAKACEHVLDLEFHDQWPEGHDAAWISEDGVRWELADDGVTWNRA